VAASRHPDLAGTEVRTAHRELRELGARLDLEAATALARSWGIHLSPTVRTRDALTAREQEVLALLCRGLSNREIAQRLFISRKTAAHHVSSILSKLAVRNRAQAVARAMSQPDLTAQHGS